MDVKELRKLTRMTQVEFANYFHIKVDTLRAWEQGVNRTPDYVLFMMCKILEVSYESGGQYNDLHM